MDRQSQKFDDMRECCMSRLASLLSQGLEPFPDCVFDLDVLLNAPVVDLRKVARALRADARFSRRVLSLSNAIMNRSGESAQSVTDALVLLGPCLFHTVVLVCAATDFGERAFRDWNAESLWSRGFRIAVTSERIAELSEYPVRGMGYLAGLLHDVGHLPFRIVAREQEAAFRELAEIQWQDNMDLEREIFGLDHCQVGRWMAKSWGLSPSLTDAVCHHHEPNAAPNDRQLAEIVCAAEFYCSVSAAQPATQSLWRLQTASTSPAPRENFAHA
jgi:HD-like signal output (HDOD) protein